MEMVNKGAALTNTFAFRLDVYLVFNAIITPKGGGISRSY